MDCFEMSLLYVNIVIIINDMMDLFEWLIILIILYMYVIKFLVREFFRIWYYLFCLVVFCGVIVIMNIFGLVWWKDNCKCIKVCRKDRIVFKKIFK